MRGTMLWFNLEKDLGALQTADGERLPVQGAAFVPDEKPHGRCAGLPIEFDAQGEDVTSVAFVDELPPRRARLRRHR